MPDPLALDPLELDEDDQRLYQRGFADGQRSIMVGWKFRPVPDGDLYGDLVYATSDQVDQSLIEALGDLIGRSVAEQIKRQNELKEALDAQA